MNNDLIVDLSQLAKPGKYVSSAVRRDTVERTVAGIAALQAELLRTRASLRHQMELTARERDAVCVHAAKADWSMRVHASVLHCFFGADADAPTTPRQLDRCGVGADELPVWQALVEFVYAREWPAVSAVSLLDAGAFCVRLRLERLLLELLPWIRVDALTDAEALAWLRLSPADAAFRRLLFDRVALLLTDAERAAQLAPLCDLVLLSELSARVGESADRVKLVLQLLVDWTAQQFECKTTLAVYTLCKKMADTTSVADETQRWSSLASFVQTHAEMVAAVRAATSAAAPVVPQSGEDEAPRMARRLKRAVMQNLLESVKRARNSGDDGADDDEEDDDDDDEGDASDEGDDDDDGDEEDQEATNFLTGVLDYVARELIAGVAANAGAQLVTPESIAAMLNSDADLQSLVNNVMRKPAIH
jgi:hypothetical protein